MIEKAKSQAPRQLNQAANDAEVAEAAIDRRGRILSKLNGVGRIGIGR